VSLTCQRVAKVRPVFAVGGWLFGVGWGAFGYSQNEHATGFKCLRTTTNCFEGLCLCKCRVFINFNQEGNKTLNDQKIFINQ